MLQKALFPEFLNYEIHLIWLYILRGWKKWDSHTVRSTFSWLSSYYLNNMSTRETLVPWLSWKNSCENEWLMKVVTCFVLVLCIIVFFRKIICYQKVFLFLCTKGTQQIRCHHHCHLVPQTLVVYYAVQPLLPLQPIKSQTHC